ncbi:MAG: ABC transporter substrate-binding protein [Gammaproteobacteria bacterium]|nr:ABC transporter substrate-binding protein [Gammaproteobacteria bacterium]
MARASTAPSTLDPAILERRAFGEAPSLAEMVARGALPPVSQRLPENPLVLRPVAEIGRYGGTLRRALTGDIIQRAGISKTIEENLFEYERPLPKSIQPDLAESYRFEDEGRAIVIKIRKGLRWSDGAPFTVDDILFWYYDVLCNQDARDPNEGVPETNFSAGGQLYEFTAVDPVTLRITSIQPLGRILNRFCFGFAALPKHAYGRFHPKYNPSSTYAIFRERTTRTRRIMEPGTPLMAPWVPVEWIRGQRLRYERNPYYWKVDTAGNQLPYADAVLFTVHESPQMIQLKFINGEIDLFGRYYQPDMATVLRSGEKEGRYQLRITGPDRGPAFYLNWDTPKTQLRTAFRDRRVRIALSHAINREEINVVVFNGLLEPSGFSFAPVSPYFSRQDYLKYSQFDLEKSRALLESAGYRDGDGDGFREHADGSRFEFAIDVRSNAPSDVHLCELVADHWREIGVKVYLNPARRDILWPRRTNGTFDVFIWAQEGPADPLSRLQDWAIPSPNRPFWHRNAHREAPDWLREAHTLFMRARTTIDPGRLRELMERARTLYSENIPAIGIGSQYTVWGANRRLGNVPLENTAATVYRGWSRPVMHEQIFVRE